MSPSTFETYTAHVGPITLDTLDDLLAAKRAVFGGVFMGPEDDDEGDDDTLDTGDDEGDDDEGDDEDEGKTPEEIAAELKATRAALVKANAEAKRRRLAAKRPAEKPKPKKKTADDDEDDDDADEREAATEAKWKGRVVRQGAKAALATAGASKPERLLRLVDVDSLDVDDDGEVEGLDDEIDRLKEEYPELFKKKRGASVETGDRGGKSGARKPQTASEKQAAAMLGK